MASRLHRLGTIYSRIEGLMRKGHLHPRDKPIWFDVYKAFPPKCEPTFKRDTPEMKVNEIFYKEDVLRAKIHKAFRDEIGPFNLSSRREATSEKWLKACQEYILEGLSEEEALEKLKVSHRLGDRTTGEEKMPNITG